MYRIQPHIDTPLHRLPESVTSDIFVLVWRGHNDLDETWRGIHPRRIPYILAAVSRCWRAIALSTSRIWVLVDLSLRTELLAAHLARSKDLPIDVDLAPNNDHPSDFEETLQILSETKSWARVSYLGAKLSLDRIAVLVDVLNSTTNANDTSIHRSIRIKYLDSPGDTSIAPTELNLRIPQSQTLRSINFDCIGLSSISDLPLFRLPGLESLKLNHVRKILPDSLLQFLDSAPNLKYLTLGSCRVRSTSNTTAAPRPRHSITLAKLEILEICRTEGIAGLNLLFHTLNMPKLWFLAFFVCSNRRWARLDWEAICHSRAVRCLVLRGFSSEALAGLLARINELDGLVWLRLYNSSFATPDEFTGQFVHRLLDASCCPRLSNLRVLFSLNTEYMKTVKELKRARPSLCIDVDSDESDYGDNDTSDGDEFPTADNEENYVEHSAY